MNRRYAVTAIFLGVAACATSVSQSPEPRANAGNSATDNNSTSAVGDVEVSDIPEIPKATEIPVRDDVICRMEKRTGSNRATRVCRSRSQNARTSREAKDTFEDLRKSQTGY